MGATAAGLTVVGVEHARVGSVRVVKTRVAVVISCDLSASVCSLLIDTWCSFGAESDEFDEEDEVDV